MDSPKFMLGVMIGALVFAFVMINLWFWNIVPVDTMREFHRDQTHVYIVVAIALGTMFGSGFVCASLFDRKKK